MKFTKPLIAVAAVLLATTFANAQSGTIVCAQAGTCSNGGLIQPTVTVEQIGFMDLYPIDWAAGDGRTWIKKATGTGAAAMSPQLIGAILVQTNMARWDVTVSSPTAATLVNSSSAVLQAIGGTAQAPAIGNASLQLYACLGDRAATLVGGTGASGTVSATGSPCTTAPLGNATATAGKVDALTAAGVSISKSLNKATGFTTADVTLTTDANKNVDIAEQDPNSNGGELSPGVPDPDYVAAQPKKVANSRWIGIYAALHTGTVAAPVAVDGGDLVGNGTYKAALVFNLVAKY